jgi:glucokinase
MEKRYAVGIDIGGSHICCALVDLLDNQVLSSSYAEQKVDNQASATTILDSWCTAIEQTLSHVNPSEILGLGFAMPGPFDYEHGIGNFENVFKYQSLKGYPITKSLQERLGMDYTIRYVNDAIAFGLGEYWYIQKEGFNRITAITLGTGLGSSFIEHGVPIVNDNRVPQKGWLGGLPYGENIADDYFTTRWFLKQYYDLTGQTATGVKEISEMAQYMPSLLMLFNVFGRELALLSSTWLIQFQTEAVILGGNIANAYALFGNAFEQTLQAQGVILPIFVSSLKEQAALLGSATLLLDKNWDSIVPLLTEM